MPIEKILARTMAVLAFVFLTLTLTYYPPSYAVVPAMFFLVLVTADVILPSQRKDPEKPWERVVSRVIIGFLIFGILGCVTFLLALWRLGPFGKFGV